MNPRLRTVSLLAGLAGMVGLSLADGALAHAERANPLDGQPAVRQRLLLLKKRLEVAPQFETTINADFRHIVGGGLKVEYHLSDMLSFGGLGIVSTAINTGLVDRIVPTLEDTVDDATREPSQSEFEQHLNSMPFHGAVYASLTPWYGKLAAFGKAFVNFDFYFQGGLSFAVLKSSCDPSICDDPAPGQFTGDDPEMLIPPDDNPNNDPPLNSGARLGLYLAGGLHVFFNEFIALDFAIRDYAFSDNPSGADFNADLFVGENTATGDDDNRFLHHLFVGLGVTIMLPAKAKRTN